MNRRGFVRGLLVGALAAAARIYEPSSLTNPRPAFAPSDFLQLADGDDLVATMLSNQANLMRSRHDGSPFKTYTAPVSHPFPPLRGHAVMLPGQIHAPHNPFEVGP